VQLVAADRNMKHTTSLPCRGSCTDPVWEEEVHFPAVADSTAAPVMITAIVFSSVRQASPARSSLGLTRVCRVWLWDTRPR
jgi:hypothetical protein